ncbi:hypothetical protein LLEC1_03104 [Akanthomyces lecanii]|uniref:Uncharacterized protein n=1 Tax=Cordyceps confragosa TaxID=2714763 RepID=A0A179I7F0_CORDF|nr:hypothetical protein LLEC1_03104 [Akanthomyces lecanii]
MELSDIFRIVNLAVGAITILGGIFGVFGGGLYVPLSQSALIRESLLARMLTRPNRRAIVLSIYMIIFGLSIGLLEFQIPRQVSRYANFLFSFVGRGVFYVFLGCLLLGERIISNIAGGVVGVIGIAYIALEFVPSIEPPANMREADAAGWGAEQV